MLNSRSPSCLTAVLPVALVILTSLSGCDKKKEVSKQVTVSAAFPSVSAFSNAAPFPPGTQLAMSSTCNIESVNMGPFGSTPVTVSKGKGVSVAGWVVDEKQKTTARSVFIALADPSGAPRYFGRLANRTARPDVGQSLRIADLVNAGFEGVLGLDAVEPGTYRVLLYIERSSDYAVCENGRTLVVAP